MSARSAGRTLFAVVSMLGLAILVTDLGASKPQRPAARAGAQAEPRGGYDKKKKAVDFVELNGPIFEGWPKPRAAILISGEQWGFLEPCGCAGLENQKGGLKRRHTLIKRLTQNGWPLVAIDLGGQIQRYGRQAEIKFGKTTEALVRLGYRAVGFGSYDLQLPAEYLLSVTANLAAEKNPFVSANVGLFEFDSGFVARYRIVNVAGRRIGITSILGTTYQQRLKNDDLKFLPPEAALAEVVPQIRDQADVLVLLSHATAEESRALAKQFPDFDIVVTAGGADEPPAEALAIEGTKTRLVEVGHKGMYVAVIGLYDDPRMPLRYQRVPLDARFEDSPEMQAILVEYQNELRTIGFEGLGLSGAPHPSGRKFVGSHVCGQCHDKAHAKWETTPHAHATETLVNLDPPRHHDPECLSCHATGWEPQEYFPYDSGYRNEKKTAHLGANGCENCHGPGSDHVAAETGEVEVDEQKIKELRAQMRLTLLEGEGTEVDDKIVHGKVMAKCQECHDPDNSPDFDFAKYWPEIEHHGKD